MNLVSPNGEVGWVDDAEAPAALKQGYRQATADEVARAKAGEQTGRAAVEGVARGVTAGLSDPLITGYLKGRGEDPSQVLMRQEENPVASGLGEVAGVMAPVGPAALIGKAGAVAKGAFAGKTAGRVAQGVTEGGLWGLGQAISEEALGDKQLSGENLAAGTLGGALIGGAVTPIFGKVGDVGRSALVKAFGGKAFKESLEDLAAKATMRQVTLPSDRTKDFLRRRSQDIGKFANQEGFTKGAPTAAEAASRAQQRAGVAAQEIDDAIQQIDQHVVFDPFNLRSRVEQELIAPMRNIPSKADSAKHLEGWLDKFFDTVQTPEGPHVVSKTSTFREVWSELQTMRSKIKAQDPSFASAKEDFFKARGILQDEFFGQAGKAFPDWETMLRRANDDLSKAGKFAELSQKTADRQAQNRYFSLTDYIIGGAAGPLAGIPVAAANKVARERGGFVIGSALQAMADSKVLERTAKGLSKIVERQLRDNSAFGGAFRATLEQASARGAMDLLETHVTLAQTDPSYLPSVGMVPEDPTAVSGYADKAHRLGTLQNSTETMQQGIDEAIEQMLKGKRAGKPAELGMSQEQYRELTQKLRELGSVEQVKRQISEIAPLTAGVAQMAILKGSQFLLEKAPKDPNENLPPALQRPWAPSRGELATWNRYVRAVADPASVFRDIQNGTVTPEGTEALRQVYPRLFQEFRDRMMSRMGELTAPLDRKKRAQISVILGDLDDPQQVALIQAMHARNKPAQPSQPDGREKIDVQRNLMTQGQRLANKEDA